MGCFADWHLLKYRHGLAPALALKAQEDQHLVIEEQLSELNLASSSFLPIWSQIWELLLL